MATEKGKASTPVAFKSKSKASSGRRFVAVTLLIEETGQANNGRRRTTTSTKKPLILDYFESYLKNGHSYGFGDWAVKSVELTEEQFQGAYESL